ncbi:MAG: class I SAM-dependent methyltransferase [Propionibacteriaceae bacterium]|jgi:SAM-dependent methyltransferase|nr:class I SAM-dependent methyltransferase [Propionibacteriaceae bacterium]
MAQLLVIPPAAMAWLLGDRPASVLVVGAAGGYPGLFRNAGHDVAVIDRDPARLAALTNHWPDLHLVAARGEALPFDPGSFDIVVAIQNFHTFAPGLALTEWARVLKPGGWVTLAYLKRDDTIPWVKRLITVIQARLPQAMTADQADAALAELSDSPYFPATEPASFRLWAPCSRADLQAQARSARGADRLKAAELDQLMDEIGRLYDTYARVPDPLQLPYSLIGRRGLVDHSELTAALAPDQFGLRLL